MNAHDLDAHPLTANQEWEWDFDHSIGSAPYHRPVLLRLRGPLRPCALREAVAAAVRRHHSLRTRYPLVDGRRMQVVDPPWSRPLPLIDLTSLPARAREDALVRIGRDDAASPFDMAGGTTVRWGLVRLAADHHALLVSPHHVAVDLWSLSVLAADIAAHYRHAAAGEPLPVRPAPLQPTQWASAERERWTSERLDAALAPWRDALARLPALELPADHPPTPGPKAEGWLLSTHLEAGLSDAVRALSRRHGVTVFVALLAAFHSMLARVCDVDRLVTYSLTARRHSRAMEDAVGLYSDYLRVFADLTGDPPFAEVLARTADRVLDGQDTQRLPNEWLLRGTDDGTRPHPLERVGFTMHNTPPVGFPLSDGIRAAAIDFDAHGQGPVTTYWRAHLFFDTFDFGSGPIATEIFTAKELYASTAPSDWARRFSAVLARIVEDDQVPLSRLPGR
ncbi:condensation domain-containing protein [Streptomyces sp. E2N166]|uniref:condensation domain-containing protein n=1 Tax=Streptomyces sp. E2N166 TaxID=1851909 RepID=UPI00187D1A86|nr:condensation domain-containing protein [Streptomyces sp. E2N166]